MIRIHRLIKQVELSQVALIRRLKMVLSINQRSFSERALPVIALSLAVISLTGALGLRFYNAPGLAVGRVAPQIIQAPADAVVEDEKGTEMKRRMARTQAVSVLKLDLSINQQITADLRQAISQGGELRQIAGAFPFTPPATLTQAVQSYLRRAPDPEWQIILQAFRAGSHSNQPAPPSLGANPPQVNTPAWAVAALQAYRQTATPTAYNQLLRLINQARRRYAAALTALPQSTAGGTIGGTAIVYDPTLLEITDGEWQQLLDQLPQLAEPILAQGIAPGLPPSVLQRAVTLQLQDDLPQPLVEFSSRLLVSILRPNLIRDEEQTQLQAEQAAKNIKPELVTIRQGEVIVRAGEVITAADFALLDSFGLSRRGVNWPGLLAFSVLVSGAVATVALVARHFHSRLRRRDQLLIWLLSLTTPLMIMLRVPATNLPAIGLLVSGFYGSALGVAIPGAIGILVALGMHLSWAQLLPSAVGGWVCGWMGSRLRSREELAKLGALIGLMQGGLYLLLNLASGAVWHEILGSATIQALIGLGWVIVAIGSSPYLEQLFDLVTTLRLVELANPNHPLLKKLAAETPGTFQHTLFVATLAEAAARALDCNVELVRAGTLYHDIGKMHDPLGFIENQMGRPNKHDQINNPWESAAIIKKHVTEGLAMARRYHLPRAVQAFIPEHQGTMLIAYFYHQAQQQANQSPNPDGSTALVQESDFRYDGPIPHCRETGIVMLADCCEAALRSLKDATAEEALSMVNKILRARWQDNQLVNSGLTREHLSQIAVIFVEIWQQFHHQRIPYPKAIQPARSRS